MEKIITRTEAISALHRKGYKLDFVIENENLLCVQKSELINPDEFEITETYRFENGGSDNNNCYVIYAVKSQQKNLKGILRASYNSFCSGLSIHLWSKLSAGLAKLIEIDTANTNRHISLDRL